MSSDTAATSHDLSFATAKTDKLVSISKDCRHSPSSPSPAVPAQCSYSQSCSNKTTRAAVVDDTEQVLRELDTQRVAVDTKVQRWLDSSNIMSNHTVVVEEEEEEDEEELGGG